MRLTAILVSLAVSGLGLPVAAQAADNASTVRAEPRVQRIETTKGLAIAGKIRASHARTFSLGAPSTVPQLGSPSKGAPLQIGFGRDVAALGNETHAASALSWQTLPDGARVAALSLTSESAASVRAALRVGALPASAVVRFQAPGDDALFEVTGAEINETLARNEAAGDKGPEARLYWSPLIDGDTILIEVELAPGSDPRDLRVSVPQVSHLVTSAAKDFVVQEKASASCEVDAMCSLSTWSSQINAVARMVFSTGSGTFICSGTLLADQEAASDIPYFLSANHCVSSQVAASSLTTYWFYRSSACDSTTIGPYRQLTGGAALLYASSKTDTSFMRLNNLPPAGAVYAGWFSGATPAFGSGATGLHHPKGDWLKISKGAIDGYLTCTAPVNGMFSCDYDTASHGTFYAVGWNTGLTEPGSSGSGLFRSDGLLIGQLYGGSSGCTDGGDDIYGRFDVAYNSSLKAWLSGQTLTVAKSGPGSGTVTSAPSGIDCGTACSASFAGGTAVTLTPTAAPGSAFAGWSGACSGLGACVVTMNSSQSVTASFTGASALLSVTTSGSGVVNSTPSGISCGSSCSTTFALGAVVSLTATPLRESAFKGWSGACSGTGSCVVTMSGAMSVSATFGAGVASTTSLASSKNPANVGLPVTFAATVSGSSGPAGGTVSFTADGAPIAGCATQPLVSGVAMCPTSALAVGDHAIVATYSGNTSYNASTSAPFTQSIVSPAAVIRSLSTRTQVGTQNGVMIGGFVIGGTGAKTVVVRARGPSLVPLGIANALADPTLQLVRASDQTVIAINDNWGTAANAAQLSASGLAPSNPSESAILITLPPGAYSAIVAGAAGGTGVGIFEVLEVDHPEMPLISISTRSQVLGGDDVMIGGFVIQGSEARSVIVRARGPSLVPAGIANAIANPMLQIVRASDQSIVAANDDWGTAANAAQILASGLAPPSALESAILITLQPGAYTAIMTGANGATGIGIVEVLAQ